MSYTTTFWNFLSPPLKAGGDYVIGWITFPSVRPCLSVSVCVCLCLSVVSNLGFQGFQGFEILGWIHPTDTRTDAQTGT